MPTNQNIVLYSTADWDNPFWTNKQHTAKRLAERGHKILYIESLGLRKPQVRSTDLKRIFAKLTKGFRGLRSIDTNLHILSPIALPGGGKNNTIQKINQKIIQYQISSALKALKINKKLYWAWTYNPTITPLIQSLQPQKIIYHNVDDLAASPGMSSDTIIEGEKLTLKSADVTFCTSQKLHRSSLLHTKNPCYYFPNVVDTEHFFKHRSGPLPIDLVSVPKPRLGFVGALSDYKVDSDLLNAVIKQKPDWSFVFIGKIGEGQPDSKTNILKRDNVYFLGPKKYKDIPNYMSHFDVGLVPCPINNYTQSMFPMKFFEYLASGTPVVARDIDSLHEFKNEHYSYASTQDFIQQTHLALTQPFSIPSKLLSQHTWNTRLDKMLDHIHSV